MRRRIAAAAAALMLLTACGNDSSPGYLAPQGDGATGRIGPIVVTDAVLAFTGFADASVAHPAGGDTPITATIVNTGTDADQLVAVSSPTADGGQVSGDPTVSPGGSLQLGSDGTGARLTQLREDVRSGATYPVDLTFARAGTLRLDLPVALPDEPRTSCSLPPDGQVPEILTAPVGAPAPPTSAPPSCSSLPS